MQFTHEIARHAPAGWEALWADWNDVSALPRRLSHVRAVACAESEDLARFVIFLDGRHREFAVQRTMCGDRTLCWQSLGEVFLYVLTLRLEPSGDGATVMTLTVAYDPPGFLPDIAETLGLSRRFRQVLEADLHRYVEALPVAA